MQKFIILLVIQMLIPFFSQCDTAPVMPVQSGCVVPVRNDFIIMQSEIVKIHLFQDHYEVDVEYFFMNTGEQQKITMGFPNQTTSMYTETINNFKAFTEDTSFAITQMFEAVDTTKPENFFLPKKFYECFDVFFKKGEIKKIKNTYTQKYQSDYNQTYRYAEYILTTGALWKDKIQDIKVYVYPQGIPAEELYKRTAYFPQIENEPADTVIYQGLKLIPESFSYSSDEYFFETSDIDPDFNIEMTLPPQIQYSISASSELKPEGVYSYSAWNINDNDPNTAWAEGVAGAGINETLEITIAPKNWGGKTEGAYKVKKIGIMNGLNSSKELFYANNRVKNIKISYYDPFSDFEYEYEAVLNDTMGMQYIYLPKTTLISLVHFQILEVYLGNKYDDTCISEIQFFIEN
jgi:hypothetical protein